MQKLSTKLFERAIFIFRRDLRLDDNIGLLHALQQSKTVIPCFILDEKQLNPKRNDYFSHNLVQFMAESLQDLDLALNKHKSRLYLFNGEIERIITLMIDNFKPQAVYTNEDVTPYAIKRDAIISSICQKNNIEFFSFEDMMLHSKTKVMLESGQFFQKFTPFYDKVSVHPVSDPQLNLYDNYIPAENEFSGEFMINSLKKLYNYNPDIEVHGGRLEGLKNLADMRKQKNYSDTRNILSLSTTKLSAYNKFGCVSIREVYKKVKEETGEGSSLVKQLYWRDFFYGVMYHYPHVVGNSMKAEYENLEWSGNEEHYQRWCKGETGCPIVDAGMRHLNTTGYLSNRMRLIVASYLVKTLIIDWKLGEKHFAKNLVDCDISQNNGGWQWVAGSGCDTQPYFRVFNPVVQSQKFDANCKYILKWVPELQAVKRAHIHRWEDFYKHYAGQVQYPAPMVKHQQQKDKVLKMYGRVVGKPHSTLGIHPDAEHYKEDRVRKDPSGTKYSEHSSHQQLDFHSNPIYYKEKDTNQKSNKNHSSEWEDHYLGTSKQTKYENQDQVNKQSQYKAKNKKNQYDKIFVRKR